MQNSYLGFNLGFGKLSSGGQEHSRGYTVYDNELIHLYHYGNYIHAYNINQEH